MTAKIKNYFVCNKKDILTAIVQNYFYGFTGWMIPVSVTIGNYLIAGITAYVFYSMLSIVVNREKYITNLGKYIWFPLPAMLGAFTALTLGDLIKNLI